MFSRIVSSRSQIDLFRIQIISGIIEFCIVLIYFSANIYNLFKGLIKQAIWCQAAVISIFIILCVFLVISILKTEDKISAPVRQVVLPISNIQLYSYLILSFLVFIVGIVSWNSIEDIAHPAYTVYKLIQLLVFWSGIYLLQLWWGSVVFLGKTKKGVIDHIKTLIDIKSLFTDHWETRLDKWLGLLLILVASLLFFNTKTVTISPDSGWYMARAVNIHNGLGFIDAYGQPEIYRGPVFMALVSFYFNIFGISFLSAYWVVRSIFVGVLVLTYLLGKKIFNYKIGLIAFFLVLTSPEIHEISTMLLLDMVMPFFVLISLYLLIWGIETEKKYFFAFSSVSMGLAYLTKATAGVFFLLPVLLMLLWPKVRMKKYWSCWGMYYLVLGIPLLPWFVYLYYSGMNPIYELIKGLKMIFTPILYKGVSGIPIINHFTLLSSNQTQEVVFSSMLNKEYINSLISYLGLYIQYYKQDFSPKFIIAPVFIVGWLVLIIKYYRYRAFNQSVLLASAILYLSLAPVQVIVDYGTRHSVILYLLSYLTVAGIFWQVNGDRVKSLQNRAAKYVLSVFAFSAIIGSQVFIGNNSWANVIHDIGYGSVTDKPEIELYGAKDIVGWFKDHSITDSKIMVEPIMGNFLYGEGISTKPLTTVPFLLSPRAAKLEPITDPLGLWNYRGWRGMNEPRVHLITVSEAQLIKQINNKGIEYIIISERSSMLAYYFYCHPDFALVRRPDNYGNTVFSVADSVHPISEYPDNLFQFFAGISTSKYLDVLEIENTSKYNRLKTKFLMGVIGLSEEQIDLIKQGNYPLYGDIKSTGYFEYIRLVDKYFNREGIKRAYEIQEDKLSWVEDKTATKELISILDLCLGNYSEAQQILKEMVVETPNDIYTSNLLVFANYVAENKLSIEDIFQIYEKLLISHPKGLSDTSNLNAFFDGDQP